MTIISGHGNNISGETVTNHNHSEKIGAADETVSQHKELPWVVFNCSMGVQNSSSNHVGPVST